VVNGWTDALCDARWKACEVDGKQASQAIPAQERSITNQKQPSPFVCPKIIILAAKRGCQPVPLQCMSAVRQRALLGVFISKLVEAAAVIALCTGRAQTPLVW
jgi:hypothetical protein